MEKHIILWMIIIKRGRKIMNSSKYCLITTTFENKEEANKISEILLKKRLVSCSQISSITDRKSVV